MQQALGLMGDQAIMPMAGMPAVIHLERADWNLTEHEAISEQADGRHEDVRAPATARSWA